MIKVECLTLDFGLGPVLHQANFRIDPGEKVLLIGASGAGKSAFLNTLMGLTSKRFVKGGNFFVDGRKMAYSHYRRTPICEKFSAIFQDAGNSLHPYRTIEAQCEPGIVKTASFAKWIRCLFSKTSMLRGGTENSGEDFDKRITPRLFRRFNLHYENLKEKFPIELSGGECQRVSMVFPFLSKNRNIVFFDEPITDIDRIYRPHIQELITETFLKDDEITVIYVTHSHRELRKYLKERHSISPHVYKIKNQKLEGPF